MIYFVFYNKEDKKDHLVLTLKLFFIMKQKGRIQLQMMLRYSARQKKEIIEEFKGTKQSDFERNLQKIIEKMIPEKEYHPRKSFPFLFIYKIEELLVVFVFYNKWRIGGKYDPKRETIFNLTDEDTNYLKKIILAKRNK